MKDNNDTPRCNMHEALVSYLYGETTSEEALRVEAHLSECAVCKQELAAFERVRGMLQHWRVDDMPVLRLTAEGGPGRPFTSLLKELFVVMPFWAKSLGAFGAAMLVLAVMGTDVSIGRNGVTLRASLLKNFGPVRTSDQNGAGGQLTTTQVKAIVNEMIADSERQQKAGLQEQLVRLESALQDVHDIHSADLARLAARIKEQREKINTLERDIDRREGLDLTDILFTGSLSGPKTPDTEGGGGQ